MPDNVSWEEWEPETKSETAPNWSDWQPANDPDLANLPPLTKASNGPLVGANLPPPAPQTETFDSEVVQPIKNAVSRTIKTVADIPINVANTFQRMTGGRPIDPDKSLLPSGLVDAFKSTIAQGGDVIPLRPSPAFKGISESAGKALEGVTSPYGLETLPLFEGKLGQAAMLAYMAKNTPEQIKQTVDVLKDPDASPEKKWEAGGDAFLNLAMQAGIALHLRPEAVKSRFTPGQAQKAIEEAAVKGGTPDRRPGVASSPPSGAVLPPEIIAAKDTLPAASREAVKNLTEEEAQNATEKVSEQESVPEQRQGDDKGGTSPEAGTSGGLRNATEGASQAEVALSVADEAANLSSMPLADFNANITKRPGGLTGDAYRIGQAVKTPADLEALKRGRTASKLELDAAKAKGDFTTAMQAAMRGQYYREAYEAATGTGSAGESLRNSHPNYKPPFPETKVLPPVPNEIFVTTPKGPRRVTVSARMENGKAVVTAIKLHNQETGSYEIFRPPANTFPTLEEAGQAGFDLVKSKFPEQSKISKQAASGVKEAEPATISPKSETKIQPKGTGENEPGLHSNDLLKKNPANLKIAGKLPDGSIIEGKTGQSHDDLNLPEGAERGFVDAKGKFLSREEAQKVDQPVNKNEETIPPTGQPTVATAAVEPNAIVEGQEQTAGLSVGPGAASPEDVPPPPPAARANNAASGGEELRPNGVVTPSAPIISRMVQWLRGVGTELRGMAGESMPRTTAAHGETGEAGVRYASSKIAARPLAALFSTHTLEGTGVDPFKLGVALSEDNLRSVRENARQRATQLLAEGKPDEAAKATAEADKVTSLIGHDESPFKTEDEYQDFLADDATQRAIAQHIQQWNEVVDPMFKEAQSLDPDTELPSRGQQTGARINLKAVFPEDETAPTKPVGGGSSPSLTNTFKRKSPFGIRAKGTGQAYEGDYHSIIANTFERQLEGANKNAFDKKLVESGLAVVDKPGQRVQIGGKPAASFPLARRLIINTKDGKTTTFPAGQNIYVRSDLAGEYRRAANVDPSSRIPFVTSTMNALNKTALAGLTDVTVHMSNLATALFNRPVSGKLLNDSLLSTFGRADVPVTIVKALLKAGKNNDAQLAELSKIGALRQSYTGHAGPLALTSRVLSKVDHLTRLMLDDTFRQMASDGLVPNTETARREYVNQVGQYNRRLQGPLMRLLRDTGFGPFATAGRTFNALGVKMATLSPGVRASSNLAAAGLRANVLSKWMGGAVLLGTLNYLLTKDKGGGMLGRPGVPLGKLDTGMSDKNKRPLLIPLFDIIGLGRALRVTGAGAAINAKRFGLTNGDAFDSAARDVFNSAIGPAAGPPVRFAMTAATGYPPAIQVGRSSPVAPPGQNQVAVNVTEALKQANPVIGTYFDWKAGKSLPEVVAHQLPRFTMSPGRPAEMMKDYPGIVRRAQANAYIDDVVGRARKLEPKERAKFLDDAVRKLDNAQDKEKARREFTYRRVAP